MPQPSLGMPSQQSQPHRVPEEHKWGNGKGLLGGGLRPLTMVNLSIVQLTVKKPGAACGEMHGPEGLLNRLEEAVEEKAERKRLALVRTQSWAADDYSYTGW